METGSKKEDCSVTKSTFNEIQFFESQSKDGRGGGRPNDCSSQEKHTASNSFSGRKEYSTGIRDPPGRMKKKS